MKCLLHLWNSAFLKDIGEVDPDDASMVIIQEVWRRLQDAE